MQSAAVVRVVGEEDVARRDPLAEADEHGGDRSRADPEVERHGRRRGDDASAGVVKDAREVPRLADERRDGRLDDRRGHLAGQVLQAVADDFEGNGIQLFSHAPPR
ncbi:MAG: hypothetical protein E6J79_02305 [Deltaproteobacteria bacterium]|nr:MAG: hypothetical protein E6J79_02305 [Deltaproteobacteria bacterium]